LLVRHGATTASHEDVFAGSIDVALSEKGQAQAEALARRLSQADLAAAYASPMLRTRRTAELVAGPHGLGVTLVDELLEIAHGRWEGKARRDVEREYCDEYAAWEADPFTFAPAGGEPGL